MKKPYYGPQTEQAYNNFPFPVHKVQRDLIYSITQIKKAAANTHKYIQELDTPRADAIIQACDEILAGKFEDQFITCAIQGGAGTSLHMNVNEVIANRASEIIQTPIHANDHVNKSQSTNDVNPSALKITCLILLKNFQSNLDLLIKACEKKAHEYISIKKLARTHLQDAIPTTLGAEFQSYADTLKRDKQRIKDCLPYLYELNLGGTAIGDGLNASDAYRKEIYHQMRQLTLLPLKPAENVMSQTSSASDFCQLSATINILCTDLSKIATDIRFLASGPRGGIHEISLAPLQAGSSIMPGKVNPVIPEAINQISFEITGKNLTIHQASQNAHLELAIMFPVMADALISMIKLASTACFVFAVNCLQSLTANPKQCEELLEHSTAYATVLAPDLGYDTVSQLVREATKTGRTLKQTIIQTNLLSEEQISKIEKKL